MGLGDVAGGVVLQCFWGEKVRWEVHKTRGGMKEFMKLE